MLYVTESLGRVFLRLSTLMVSRQANPAHITIDMHASKWLSREFRVELWKHVRRAGESLREEFGVECLRTQKSTFVRAQP